MTLYRDPLAGLRAQVATKRGLVALREGELPPLLRSMLPAALRASLDELRPRALGDAGAEAEGIDALTTADAALDALLAAHDEAIALVPKLRDCPLDVPDPPRPSQRPPWLIEEERQRALRRRFEERVRDVAEGAHVVRWGDFAYLARLRIAGAPVVALTRGNFDGQAISTTFASTVRTSVPACVPPLSVKRERPLDAIATALRLARDDETGDAAFDDAFVVDGREGGLLLLTADVTAALGALVPWSPALVVRSGIVEVSWGDTFRDSASELMHDAALAAVLGVRAAVERA